MKTPVSKEIRVPEPTSWEHEMAALNTISATLSDVDHSARCRIFDFLIAFYDDQRKTADDQENQR